MKSLKSNLLAAKKRSGLYMLAGAVCGFTAFAGILCALAFALCRVDVPVRFLSPMVITAVCGAVLLAAMVFTYLHKKRGLLYGALFGAGVFLLLWGISILQGNSALTQLVGTKAIAMICAGAIGGYVGVLRSEKKRKIH